MTPGTELTRALARYAVGTRFDRLPDAVQREAARALLNWVGVAIGGCRERAVEIAAASVADTRAAPQATIIGQGFKTDPASAAFVNCIASSVQAFDDAHLSSVAHPSGPAASAVLAVAETRPGNRPVSGEEFLNAIALCIELQCRVANMLVLPPSTFHPAIYVNGFSGPIGVAAAVGRLMGLDEQRMVWAIGLAASQASGFRATHGTMTAHFRPGHATRAGVSAALLAKNGFDCTDDALEAAGGFLDIFAPGADVDRALAGIGHHHEMLANRYKPYPCGIVIHPTICACLEIRERLPAGAILSDVRLRVNPLVLKLTGKREPRTPLESHVSVYHWAAVALLRGKAGLAETAVDCLVDREVSQLRSRIVAASEAEMAKGEARVEVTLGDGTRLKSHIVHGRGSLERPMSDAELEAKFVALAGTRLSHDATMALAATCWGIATCANAGSALCALLP